MLKGISKESLKILCDLASSEKDKKLIRVAATAHLSAKKARKELGINDLAIPQNYVIDYVLSNFKDYEREIILLQMSKINNFVVKFINNQL